LKIGNNIKNALSKIEKEICIINQDININDKKIFEKEEEKELEKKTEKALINIIFNINGRSKIDLQCYDNELAEDVIKRVCTISELKYTKILIIFGNKNIKLNQSLRRNGIYENKKKLDIITDVIFYFQN
jgi:4-diphosphocytidyl-2C-methyl-D-erythritol kinase